MKVSVALFALLGLAAATSIDELPRSRPNDDDVDYYDCKGKPDGNYLHPFDCTRFIKCHNFRAADFACPDCGVDTNVQLCAGNPYLVFDLSKDRCEWPATTECAVSGTNAPVEPTTHAPEEPETTPEAPATEDPVIDPHPTTEKDDGGDDNDECASSEPGQACNPTQVNCDQCDVCVNMTSLYKWCKPTIPENPFVEVTGVWVEESCSHGHLINFNDTLAPGLSGGLCTPWDFLPTEVKEAYLTQDRYKECGLARDLCEYGQNEGDECTGKYYFIESTLRPEDKSEKNCPNDNIWDMATENCRPCSEVEACKGKC